MDIDSFDEYSIVKNKLPHIAENLKTFWNSQYFEDYVTSIMLDTRDGARKGFPIEIAKALNELSRVHSELFPKPPVKEDIWINAHRF